MSDLDPFDENRRGPARLGDREFVQLLVDLGEVALHITQELTPDTYLTEWEVSFILERYHEQTHPDRPCRLAAVAG